MRILVADNEANVRFAVRALLKQQPGVEAVDEASDARELMALTKGEPPDVVLLHWHLQGVGASEMLRVLRTRWPGTYVVALSAQCEARGEALAAGADCFVSKMESPDRLLSAIDDGLRHRGERIDGGRQRLQRKKRCE